MDILAECSLSLSKDTSFYCRTSSSKTKPSQQLCKAIGSILNFSAFCLTHVTIKWFTLNTDGRNKLSKTAEWQPSLASHLVSSKKKETSDIEFAW